VARTWENRNACKVLVEKSDGRRPLRRPKLIEEDNIKNNLKEIKRRGHY
jgi:hypothetical protein